MANLTLAQVRTLTRDLVGDPAGDTYSLTQYQDAINFAIKDYGRKTGATYAEANVTPDANGFCTLPTGYVYVKRVFYTVGGTTVTQLTESTFNFESMKSATWQTLTGVPKRWVLWSGAKVKLTPIPSPIYTAVVGYVEDPTDITSDSSTVDARIPEGHNEYLKYAAAAWLKLLDGDNENVAIADNYMERFNHLIGYRDPILELKMSQTRTEGKREV